MPTIAPQLTLWAALGNHYAQAATGFMGVPVAEEFPQRLTTLVRRGMQLLRQFPSLLLGVDLDMQQCVLGWCWTYGQPAEPINEDMGLPWTMMDG